MTKLLYVDDMCKLNCKAHIIEVRQDADATALILDQTVFYPQGGGQPADKGIAQNDTTQFQVQGVSKDGEQVLHKGVLVHGPMLKKGDEVELTVDSEVRLLHNKNHTGGHLIDFALMKLGYTFKPHKAYHFPQGPYVEYVGAANEAMLQQLRDTLESAVNELMKQDVPVSISLIDNDPKQRVMSIPGYEPILCGGTHVLSTAQVGRVTIRKIKNEKGNLRVSYAVE